MKNTFWLVIDHKDNYATVQRVTSADNVKRYAKDNVYTISVYSTKKEAERVAVDYNKNKVVRYDQTQANTSAG